MTWKSRDLACGEGALSGLGDWMSPIGDGVCLRFHVEACALLAEDLGVWPGVGVVRAWGCAQKLGAWLIVGSQGA